jgi:ABC-type nickel/cobalt efflux system permease component RcnA
MPCNVSYPYCCETGPDTRQVTCRSLGEQAVLDVSYRMGYESLQLHDTHPPVGTAGVRTYSPIRIVSGIIGSAVERWIVPQSKGHRDARENHMRHVPVLVVASVTVLIGIVAVIALLAVLKMTNLNDSVAFGIVLVAAMAIGLGVGFATLRVLKRTRK